MANGSVGLVLVVHLVLANEKGKYWLEGETIGFD